MPPSILLLGAGELGTAILRALRPALSTQALCLTLAVRDPSRYKHLATAADPIDFLPLDLLTATPTTLAETFSAHDIVLVATGFALPPGAQLALARAALDAGKARQAAGKKALRFFPWQWGVDYDVTGDAGGLMPLFGEQLAVRQLLRLEAEAAGVQWTVVSTGVFMSFLFEGAFGVVEKEGVVRALGSWENRVTVTTVEDIARVAAALVSTSEGREMVGVVYTAGETVSYARLAEVVEGVSGRDVRREVWSVDFLKEELAKDPEDVMKKYRVVFAEGAGVSWDEERTVNRKLGMAVTGIEAWARANYNV